VSVLGEHLISDQAVGLIELVKNAHDADATEVHIELFGLAKPETTTVIIRDNGTGMTLSDLEDKWLSPAVDHKERDKQQSRRTPLGRLPIGEKGVGRFAVHQMGRRLQLVTRPAGADELVVPIDWDVFDSGEKYLDSMTVTIREREPEVFKEKETGTLLKIGYSRSQWTRQLVEKVHRTLRRLQSPIKGPEGKFEITFQCPEYPEYENISPTDILERAHYEFRALIDETGQCDFEYECRHPALPARSQSGATDLVSLASKELQAGAPSCGPFWINLYVWDRAKDYLAKAQISPKELNAQCGISLFRDGLRVLPYGEPGDDWLLLDQERIQDPSGRISNNQVIGIIQVLQEKTLQLRDKTNREGLIENSAFRDLRAMARAAIRLFTTYWKKDRPREDTHSKQNGGSLVAAKRVATALEKTASNDISVEVPVATLQGAESHPQAISQQEDVHENTATVSQRQALGILITNIDGAAASFEETEKQTERLLTLAATGLAAERVVHEFGRQVTSAFDALGRLKVLRGDEKTRQLLNLLATCLETLRKEFRILAPYESIERKQRPEDVSIKEAAELALLLNKREIDEYEIQSSVDGVDFAVRCHSAALVQILDNLVHNSCYWLRSNPDNRERRLGIVIDRAERHVLVVDSGPGLHTEAKPHLFAPFFSMKAGGTGLGLYISKETAIRLRANLRFATDADQSRVPPWATGAVFVLELPRPSSTRG
jgi:signal transduction histidine kinase